MTVTIPPAIATALLIMFFIPAIFVFEILMVICGYYSPVRDDLVPATRMSAWWAAKGATFITAAILWLVPSLRQRIINGRPGRTTGLVFFTEWMASGLGYVVTALLIR